MPPFPRPTSHGSNSSSDSSPIPPPPPPQSQQFPKTVSAFQLPKAMPTTNTSSSLLHTKAHDMEYMDYWPQSLKHKTELVQEQLESGLYAVKRYAFVLQKVVEIKKPALTSILKIIDYEGKSKTAKVSRDAMTPYVSVYNETQDILVLTTESELNYINSVDKDVVHYLLNWHKSAEKKLETINKRLSSIYSKQKDMLLRIAKSRSECHKQWNSLQSAFKESEKADQNKLTKKNGAKEYEQAFKKYSTLVTKTANLFNSFEIEVRDGNSSQELFWTIELPQCLSEFEQLETDRLKFWGVAMENFHNSRYEYFSKISQEIHLGDITNELDGTADIKYWTEMILNTYGQANPPEIIPEYLPCSHTHVLQGDELQQLLSIDLSVALQQREREQQQYQQQHQQVHSSPNRLAHAHGAATNTTPPPPKMTKPSCAHAIGKVIYDLSQNDKDDLELTRGDYIAVLDMPPLQTGEISTWWIGAKFDFNTGKILEKGIIPSNYITFDY